MPPLRLRPLRARRGAAPARPSLSRGTSYSRLPLFPTRPRPLAIPRCHSRAVLLSTCRVQSPQLRPRAWARAPRGCQGPRAGAGALGGGGGRGLERVGAALRPRAPPELLPRDPPPPLPPIFFFFFPGKLSRARPGGGRGRGCLLSFLSRLGRSRYLHPVPRPLGAGPRPQPRALADLRAGRGRGQELRLSSPSPAPGRPERGYRAQCLAFWQYWAKRIDY